VAELGAKARTRGGRGLAVLSDWIASSSYQNLLGRLQAALPEAKFYDSGESRTQSDAGLAAMVGLPSSRVRNSFVGAQVIVAVDADPLGLESETVRLTREYADGRRLMGGSRAMNRLYVIEPSFSLTGSVADHRLLVAAGAVQEFVIELARELSRRGALIGGTGSSLPARLGQTRIADQHASWIKTVTEDLLANQGASCVVVGSRQPEWVHALVLFFNEALGNIGKTVAFFGDGTSVSFGYSDQLAQDLKSGAVTDLVIIGGNPVYSLPGDLGFESLVAGLESSIYLGFEANETSAASKLAIPMAHGLEAWGDTYTLDGTFSVRQPLIAPLFPALSELEFAEALLGGARSGYDVVRATFKERIGASGDFEAAWQQSLMLGVAPFRAVDPLEIRTSYAQLEVVLRQQTPQTDPSSDAVDIVFAHDYRIYDGRYNNHAWLQEMPDPMTKLTWDNALLVGPALAGQLGLAKGDRVEINVAGSTSQAAVLVQPGVAPGTAVLSLGFGRRQVGRVGEGTGFDTAGLRSYRSPFLSRGAKIRATGETYLLALTQLHSSMEGRPIIRESSLEGFNQNPRFVDKYEVLPIEKHKTFLWTEPNPTTGHQWGMTIDLNSCTGCNTCAIACQSENNIAIVGKKEVDRHRHMAWMRIDTYFSGEADNPQVLVQPVNCMHCETAPCEGVCPVAATVHSPEGMNDMAYNRCIGTRYCANNCPYKVRKFNYFNFSKRQNEMNPLIAMQQNPNVTVRFRGVIEKCTYCVQRVNKARIEAKTKGNGIIPEGAVQTACEQACPAGAIVFGDINAAGSRVAKAKAEPRNYALLGELNTRPRTTYLAKIRNPHANLV
jgi:molybdopterin-containing oxidoreductase family iron-sulfur binding subunit